MKYWNDKTTDLIKEYNSSEMNKLSATLKLLKQNPDLLRYAANKLDSSIGMHQVYLVTFKNEHLKDTFKIGYTKHKNLRDRFVEGRWNGKKVKWDIDKIIRQVELPALGAVEFEKCILKNFPPSAVIEGSEPGAGEFYKESQLFYVLELWNDNINEYKDMWGIKSPN